MRQSDIVFNYFFYLFRSGKRFDEKKALKQSLYNYIDHDNKCFVTMLIDLKEDIR